MKDIKKKEELKLKKSVAAERNVAMPKSPKENLEVIKYILMTKGFDIKDIKPRTLTHYTTAMSQPDIYIPKISFSVNGMSVDLYGNKLAINEDVDNGNYNLYDVKSTLTHILNRLKNNKRESKKNETAKPARKLVINTLIACIIPA